MKRSKAMRLVLIGSTPLMLAGCGHSHPGNLYRREAPGIDDDIFNPEGTCRPFASRDIPPGGAGDDRSGPAKTLMSALHSTSRGGFGARGHCRPSLAN